MHRQLIPLIYIFVMTISSMHAQDQSGYQLWLPYQKIDPSVVKKLYAHIKSIRIDKSEDVVYLQASRILTEKLSLLLSKDIKSSTTTGQIYIRINPREEGINEEGYTIATTKPLLTISGKTSAGVLYGVMKIISMVQSGTALQDLKDSPKVQLRVLNHWDNLDRTVERGYAGFSIFNWHELPNYIDQRYEDYALACASIGINGAVITNVNANAWVLRSDYLKKAAALATVFQRYNIKLYLTARFNAPMELGKLTTADPLDPKVIEWWQSKVEEIYNHIPNFGGFVVKANSEGQPGPQDYNRTHAQGANMLARALQAYGGIVMWRAFVYSHDKKSDRLTQAYHEFKPLDGAFDQNVLIQVKNGPLDFQPREPIHPLFGSMTKTPLMLELQITKEYLGQGTHLVGLGPMYKEILDTKTYTDNNNSPTVADLITAKYAVNKKITGIAGVSNVGTALNWTGNYFGQADWYCFGRLSWDPYASIASIYKDWAALTFDHKEVRTVALDLLMHSHEACVNYMTPLGLHHIMAEGHHYGPGPWVDSLGRADWTAVYYHKATKDSIGYNRTATGNNALAMYPDAYKSQYEHAENCPLDFLLWFHRLPWDYTLSNGNTLWHELNQRYDLGVKQAEDMYIKWQATKPYCNPKLFQSVNQHLIIQKTEAKWWRDACLSYFHHISGRPFPKGVTAPPFDYYYYKNISHPYAPGLKPKW